MFCRGIFLIKSVCGLSKPGSADLFGGLTTLRHLIAVADSVRSSFSSSGNRSGAAPEKGSRRTGKQNAFRPLSKSHIRIFKESVETPVDPFVDRLFKKFSYRCFSNVSGVIKSRLFQRSTGGRIGRDLRQSSHGFGSAIFARAEQTGNTPSDDVVAQCFSQRACSGFYLKFFSGKTLRGVFLPLLFVSVKQHRTCGTGPSHSADWPEPVFDIRFRPFTNAPFGHFCGQRLTHHPLRRLFCDFFAYGYYPPRTNSQNDLPC